jgi:phage tail tape-measure protein
MRPRTIKYKPYNYQKTQARAVRRAVRGKKFRVSSMMGTPVYTKFSTFHAQPFISNGLGGFTELGPRRLKAQYAGAIGFARGAVEGAVISAAAVGVGVFSGYAAVKVVTIANKRKMRKRAAARRATSPRPSTGHKPKPPQLTAAQRRAIAQRRARDSRGKFK